MRSSVVGNRGCSSYFKQKDIWHRQFKILRNGWKDRRSRPWANSRGTIPRITQPSRSARLLLPFPYLGRWTIGWIPLENCRVQEHIPGTVIKKTGSCHLHLPCKWSWSEGLDVGVRLYICPYVPEARGKTKSHPLPHLHSQYRRMEWGHFQCNPIYLLSSNCQ